MEQRPIEADPSTATLYSGLGAVAVTVGERSGRVFLWYLYEGLDPAALRQTLLDEAPRLTFDVAREYLMFGPEIGRIDCYIPSDDLVLRRDDVQQMLRVLPTLPQSDWGRSLRESGVCRPPLAQNVSAMDALSVLSTAGHDEGIVVRDSGTYVGLIFRDQIVTHLLRSLSESGGS
jgi:hypothetical protein